MSLEDQMGRLANAIAMHDDVAVREIIKQRDEANRLLEAERRSRQHYENRVAALGGERDDLNRRIAALRGVITRMKAKP